MYLFFDTETTGMVNFKGSHEDRDQPRIVQIAAILADEERRVRQELCFIIKPDGPDWQVGEKALEVHGITRETAEKIGIKMSGVLMLFHGLVKLADVVIAHNIQFDHAMLKIEAFRNSYQSSGIFHDMKTFCTMNEAKDLIRLPPSAKMKEKKIPGYKPPSLKEAYEYFERKELENAHDAMADCRACMAVFWHIQRLKGYDAPGVRM